MSVLANSALALVQGPDQLGENTLESWRLLNLPQLWVVVLIIVPAVLLLAIWTYRRESLPVMGRSLLVGLRACSIGLLLLVLARPVKVTQQQSIEPAEVAILIDDSASMRRTVDMDSKGGSSPLSISSANMA